MSRLNPYERFSHFVSYCENNGADVRYGKSCVVINYCGRTTTAHKPHGTDKWNRGLTRTKLKQLGISFPD